MFLLSGTVSAKEAIIDMFEGGGPGGSDGRGAGGAEAAVHCPKALDPSEIANFDYAWRFTVTRPSARAPGVARGPGGVRGPGGSSRR